MGGRDKETVTSKGHVHRSDYVGVSTLSMYSHSSSPKHFSAHQNHQDSPQHLDLIVLLLFLGYWYGTLSFLILFFFPKDQHLSFVTVSDKKMLGLHMGEEAGEWE